MGHPGYAYPISSYFAGLFISLSLVGGVPETYAAQSPSIPQELSQEALRAINEYFLSSDRKVRSIKLGATSWIIAQEYLIEAEVAAQASFSLEYISYHCGVFIQNVVEKGQARWSVKLTTCEAYTLSGP